MLIFYPNPYVIPSRVFIGLYSILFAPKTTVEIFSIGDVNCPIPNSNTIRNFFHLA